MQENSKYLYPKDITDIQVIFLPKNVKVISFTRILQGFYNNVKSNSLTLMSKYFFFLKDITIFSQNFTIMFSPIYEKYFFDDVKIIFTQKSYN